MIGGPIFSVNFTNRKPPHIATAYKVTDHCGYLGGTMFCFSILDMSGRFSLLHSRSFRFNTSSSSTKNVNAIISYVISTGYGHMKQY